MPEQTTSPARRERTLSPLLLLIILLLLLLLGFALSNWFLNQCLAKLAPPTEVTQAKVLGVTNLDVSGDLDQAQGGGVVNFSVTGEHDEPLQNALIVFDTTGMGTIQSAPMGSGGLCIKVSDTQALCTGINLGSNETINYVVPVVVDTACGLLGTDRVGLNVTVTDNDIEDATANADIGCASAATTSSSTTTSTQGTTSTTTGTQTSTQAGGSTTTTSDVEVSDEEGDGTVSPQEYADQVAACYSNANLVLLGVIGVPLLLLLVIYAIASIGRRSNTSS